MRPAISVVINTLNEEANIADCIQSVQGLADEVVVCDMHSTDRTAEVAQSMGARVVLIEAELYAVGPMRHLAVQQAQYPWVLVIDADERMTPELALKLRQIADEDRFDVVFVSFLYWYFGAWVYHGVFFLYQHPRFFKRAVYLGRYSEADEIVHSDLASLNDVKNQLVLPKTYYLKHYAYPTIEKYVSKTLGMYARVEAEQLHRQGRKFSLLYMLGQPAKIFFDSFIRRRGYRDGMRGFILTTLYAGYRFTTWANLWLIEELKRQRLAECPNDL